MLADLYAWLRRLRRNYRKTTPKPPPVRRPTRLDADRLEKRESVADQVGGR